MKRKQFKRNVQAQRQRRSTIYMVERNERVYQRRETLKNAVGGLVMGLLVLWIILKWLGIY